jgi:hypothetical protein
LEKNKHTLLRDQCNRHHRDQDRTLDPTFVADSLEPELPPDNIQSEDADENIETEDSPEQVLENPGHIHDGLSDPDESPDDADIVDDSDLRQFASALQEAQRRAVQLESELAKTKRRTPKTYRGDSKRTLHRRDVARKALASRGFHDPFTFMALKEKNISQQRDPGDGGLTICSLPGRTEPEDELGGHDGDGTTPGPVDCAQYGGGMDVGGECMTAEPCSPVPGPNPLPSPIPSPFDQRRAACDENEPCTLAEEEEESSGEEESPSFLYHMCYWVIDADERTSESGGDSGNEPLERRPGKERNWAAEEEEESSNKSLKLAGGVARYKKASREDGTSDAGVGLMEGWCAGAENDSDGADEMGGRSPGTGPVPSQSPTVLSGGSNEFDLESGGVSSALEDADTKRLEGWKDREALAKALLKLQEKSRNLQLDLILRAHLTGMIGVLNLYLDPQLQSNWTELSVVVAKIEGHGVNRARNLREWILRFIQSGELPVHHLGQSRWTIFDDKDLSQTLQTLLLSHTKGRYITASDVVELVSGPVMQEKFTRSGVSCTSISERTARRWLQQLSWRYGAMCNGMYLDGHEREDVVAYRNAFVARWKVYDKWFHTWDSEGVEHRPQNAFPVEGGRFRLILVTHDESVFYQNDFRKTHWIASTSKAAPLPKGDGQSIMVSDFLTSEWGRLLDMTPDGVLESVFNSFKAHMILTIPLQGSKGYLQTRHQ